MRWLGLAALLFCASAARAGSEFEVVGTSDGKATTYRVKFGGGKIFEQWTAFDPATKKFVYLSFKRSEQPPEPAATIWDHRTGETIKLYKFPGAEHPLPVIPSIEAMKVCPLTGDKNRTAKRILFFD